MSDNSSIEWTDASWNSVRGCSKVSAGCKNCYAETFSERWRGIKGHPFEQGFDLRLVPKSLPKPFGWKKARRVFVNSMSDLFHEQVPFEYIAAVFGVMASCPQHTFQVLTKRPRRMLEWFAWLADQRTTDGLVPFIVDVLRVFLCKAIPEGTDGPWSSFSRWAKVPFDWPLQNVHLGVSAENQETADERIPVLLSSPAAVRFVSAEPLLGPILFPGGVLGCKGHLAETFGNPLVNWVIVGGESGPGARPCDLAWIRGIVEQCQAASVPAFVKQLGARPAAAGVDVHWAFKSRKGGDMAEWPPDLRVREFPEVAR